MIFRQYTAKVTFNRVYIHGTSEEGFQLLREPHPSTIYPTLRSRAARRTPNHNFPLPKTNIIYEDKRDLLYSQIITTNLLSIDKRRSKEEDEGGKTDNSGNREESSTVITRVGGDQVGGGCGGFKNGSINHHLWCFNGGGTVEGNSLVGRGHEGGSGSNKEGEKEEGTHLDSLLERLVNGLC
mmetsp:Transcript_79/g.183  ORF Transcript_79/g.183 Transcript_79/m.183 type:complete len:182 (+) Transcript_79:768-1313(+)